LVAAALSARILRLSVLTGDRRSAVGGQRVSLINAPVG